LIRLDQEKGTAVKSVMKATLRGDRFKKLFSTALLGTGLLMTSVTGANAQTTDLVAVGGAGERTGGFLEWEWLIRGGQQPHQLIRELGSDAGCAGRGRRLQR
jgi:hypothetical protein